MSSRNTFLYGILAAFALFLISSVSFGQSDQYKREKPAAKKEDSKKDAGKPGAPAAPGTAAKPDDKSDKLDISDLEQKYWAPKDTDFSVVQNRTYTKAGKLGVSLMTGPIINDTF